MKYVGGHFVVWRFWSVCGLLCLLPASLIWHFAHLQVIPGAEKGFQFLREEGEARTLRSEQINAYRGVITDRNGELLAVSTPVKSLYANPQKIKSADIPKLAKALNTREKALAEKFKKYAKKKFVYLARHLPPHKADQVLKHKFQGVFAETEYRRYYPAGEVAAHVVGFTNIDDKGQEGIELAYEDWLSGAPGSKKVLKDLKGNIVKQMGLLTAPVSGKDLQLSIDLRLQYLAYKELKSAVNEQEAKSGSLVMLDVESGEILAMVNQPSYNPNDRSKLKSSALRNRSITDVFEPGSTMKPFTVMAALETGKYRPDHKIDTSPGHLKVGHKTLLDPVNYGVLDLTKIIAKSSQVGISKLALELEPDVIRGMYFRAGLGQGTGLAFPGESIGVLPNHAKWHPIEVATLAYGYGLSVNAVQLAQAYNVIASRGEFRAVSLLRNRNGHRDTREKGEEVVDSKVTSQVLDMLKKVAQAGGTGTRAQISAYPVAGKSGTAHKAVGAGYADDRYVAFFAGMAPADKPKVVAVVIINEPSNGRYFGGEAAAPVFASVVEKTLRVLRVPPKHDERSNDKQKRGQLVSQIIDSNSRGG